MIGDVLNRNVNFKTILKIGEILLVEHVEEPQKFKYAPVTSCDVKRSFSTYNINFDRKETTDNLEKKQ